MSTRDQRALLYDLVGTLRETKVFGFRGKYGCKAETPRGRRKNFLVTNTITENAVVDVLLEIPGDETMEGQVECLLVYHPGKRNVWKCPKCACNVFNAPVLLRKHYKIQHPRVQIMFRCGTCEFKSENSRSVGTHMRMCSKRKPTTV